MQPGGDSSQLDIRIDAKTYPGANGQPVTAVRNFALGVKLNSFIALLGPSGCGKTTILRILAGLDPDFDGTINWNMTPRIGFVFQEPRLLPWRTVRQNIRLAAGQDRDDSDIESLAEQVGIEAVLDRFPSELSLGLARRAAIVRAFACEPNVLLLDEPFVSLDEANAGKLRKQLTQIWSSQPVTAVLVTHNLREALELADRLILLAPRPTRLLADIPLKTPHAERNAQQLDQISAKIRAEHPAFFS